VAVQDISWLSGLASELLLFSGCLRMAWHLGHHHDDYAAQYQWGNLGHDLRLNSNSNSPRSRSNRHSICGVYICDLSSQTINTLTGDPLKLTLLLYGVRGGFHPVPKGLWTSASNTRLNPHASNISEAPLPFCYSGWFQRRRCEGSHCHLGINYHRITASTSGLVKAR